MISLLFRVPCPTPDGKTAKDPYDKRVAWISATIRLEGDLGLVTEESGG